MTTSAHSVITAIRARRPELPESHAHLLLFFAQGHHLADTGGPLFADPLHATGDGVHVEPDDEAQPMNNRLLGTVGQVLHRYADMTAADLRSLVQISSAWQLAHRTGDDTRIEWVWLADWFSRPAEREGRPTREQLTEQATAYVALRKARTGG